jgi:hypothetical protein
MLNFPKLIVTEHPVLLAKVLRRWQINNLAICSHVIRVQFRCEVCDEYIRYIRQVCNASFTRNLFGHDIPMGITPVRSNRSALSFVVEPVVVLSSFIVGYVLSVLFSCLVSTELVSVSLSCSVLIRIFWITKELLASSGCCREFDKKNEVQSLNNYNAKTFYYRS